MALLLPCSRRVRLLLAALLVLSPFGCGDSKRKTVAISGKVVYANGMPLTTGTIVFNPLDESEHAPLSAIQSNGTFEFSSGNGITPGEYRVSLTTPEGEAAPGKGANEEESRTRSFQVPKKYLHADTSGWKVTIKESGNEPLTFTIR